MCELRITKRCSLKSNSTAWFRPPYLIRENLLSNPHKCTRRRTPQTWYKGTVSLPPGNLVLAVSFPVERFLFRLITFAGSSTRIDHRIESLKELNWIVGSAPKLWLGLPKEALAHGNVLHASPDSSRSGVWILTTCSRWDSFENRHFAK